MKTVATLILVILLSSTCLSQQTPRVAIVDFSGDERGDMRSLLQSAAGEFELLDAPQTRAAVRGAGYHGSLNLSRSEASDLGATIGCDFYFLGRVANLRRLGLENEGYFECSAAVFLVEAQSGQLILFDLPSASAPIEAKAYDGLLTTAKTRLSLYTRAIRTAFQKRVRLASEPVDLLEETVEVLDGEVVAKGVVPPVFYQRLKPTYTSEAALANVAATVELNAVFGQDGKVSRVDLVKWAGFGLDESAVATVRAIRFRPAERNGRPVNVLALVRYNFVRPPSNAEREIEAEKLRRSLRQIGKP
ncbi:MAG: energy transducer TonB [Acidobacteriota bacterium]